MLVRQEFAEIQASAGIVQAADVAVEPDVLAADGRNALRAELYAEDRVAGQYVSAASASLHREVCEVEGVARLLEIGTVAELYAHDFSLSVGVGREVGD